MESLNRRILAAGLLAALLLAGCAKSIVASPAEPTNSAARSSPSTMDNKVVKTDAEWRKELTPEQYEALRQKGTERAFTGKY